MTGLRFSFNVDGFATRDDFVETCRRAERCGYDVIFAADHLGIPAPFPVLVAAAEATRQLRLGTLVLNVPFWNPALLAREVATTDILTEGRLELGLGAGHMKWEFDEAGIPWQPFGARTDRLAETIEQLGRAFAQDGYPQQEELRASRDLPALRPVQRHGFGGFGPPLIVGGTSDRVLETAARNADVVSIPGIFQAAGQPPGAMRLGTPEEAAERVRYATEHAGRRADRIEWHVLVQLVVHTDDRRATAEQLAQRYGRETLPPELLLRSPFVLLGTTEQMAEQVLRNRQRYGFTHYTAHAPYFDALAPVIERVRDIEG